MKKNRNGSAKEHLLADPFGKGVLINHRNVLRTKKPLQEIKIRQHFGYDHLIGVDEVGRGCLAGPVMSCAFVFNQQILLKQNLQLNDSKKLSPAQRDLLFPLLIQHHYCIGTADSQEIDELNILQATFLSMQRAIAGLFKKHPELERSILMVDGSFCIPSLTFPHHYAVIDGDQWVSSISAASIIAKVTRDRWMEALDEKIPGYDFARHKGYGTKIHREALAKLGISPEHRRSFKGVCSDNSL